MDIAIDFDGTCVAHEFPRVGGDIGAVPVLKALVASGHRLILFTMRSNCVDNKVYPECVPAIHNGPWLDDAVNWFKQNDIPLYGVQSNPTQKDWTTSPKCYAQLYIDDAALGIPLIESSEDRPFVDWVRVEELLIEKGIITSHKQTSPDTAHPVSA